MIAVSSVVFDRQPSEMQAAAGPSLPSTIEGATHRYLTSYETHFQGPVSERCRLKDYAEAKIHALRKKAPNFFENKLPQIVNQAASSLLSYDTSTDAGSKAFNACHADFLRVLDELKKSQPAGDISFQSERDRAILKEELRKQHLKIRDRITDLEAQELSVEELGCDEDTDGEPATGEPVARRQMSAAAAARLEESRYQKIFAELDDLKRRLKQVATRIAMMEGETLDDEMHFELKAAPRTMLERLDRNQLKRLETQIAQFLSEKKSRREFPIKTVVEGWLTRAGVLAVNFKQPEFNDLIKDTSDAIRTFFRERENERRNEYFDSLINNKKLLPKEGIILSSPDDIPEDVRAQLELSEKRSKRKLDEYCEQYSRMPCEEDRGCDDLEADHTDDEAENELEREMAAFKRVKEEPRDDCNPEEGSYDEVVLREETANQIEITLGDTATNETVPIAQQAQLQNPTNNQQDFDSDISDFQEAMEDAWPPAPSTGQLNIYRPLDSQQLGHNLDHLLHNVLTNGSDETSAEEDGIYEEDDEDEELECLGVVEPQDKCPTIDLTQK